MGAGSSNGSVAVPESVQRLAGGGTARLIWRNEIGGLTFELTGSAAGRRFVKWAPVDSPADLQGEADRLRWAAAYTPVPVVVDLDRDDTGSWLVTRAIDGTSTVAPRWIADPETAVVAIGEGLRALHEALPAASCPFSWTAEERLASARRRAEAGRVNPEQWHLAHRHLSVETALDLVKDPPPPDTVVCHGDSCAPNTLVDDAGRWCAHVDLGALGLADRWADLAIATWSTEWNYGPGWEPLLLKAYGTSPDPERIRYYRLLWDLGE
jgi:kanamycin kinase